MRFDPKLSNIQSKVLFRIKKLLRSEWLEEFKTKSDTIKGVDIGDSNLRVNGQLLHYLTEDYVFDFNGNRHPLMDLLEQQTNEVTVFLDTFIFQDE
tara:strand:+ start:3262 stop:3549 length:288 start_codon:yes stop_codon:yes gene_type:complete